MVELNKGLAFEALNDTADALRLLETRRSASAKAMTGPGPSGEQLDRLLNIAVRVPDHGKLTPWRFIVFEGDARERAGEIVAGRYHELHPDHGEETLQVQRTMFSRAPCVVAVVSTAITDHPKIPEWEQLMSAGAVCQNMLVAATAMGLAAQWISGWFSFDRHVLTALGLADSERIAGFIYLGTPAQLQEDRPRPEPASLTTRF
ncbi:nitroreductase family protein [Anderseniella sp. Alg231-50]|uniref:nitroreductase family protein n=1 Tax=Anderseniella sp. Alg231-50 TaxID=1922226 RepID=UPI000D55F21B